MTENRGSVPYNLSWAWAQQRVWSQVASNLKRDLDRARTSALMLAIAAAVLTVAAAQSIEPAPEAGRLLSAVAAVGAGVATVIQRRIGAGHVRAWTQARSVSEGLKSEVYAYLAGGSTYTDDTDRDRVLGVSARRIVKEADNLGVHALGVTSDDTPPPNITGLADYLTERVGRQIDDYYRPRAAVYERRVRRLRGLSLTLGVITVVLSAVATSFAVAAVAAWVPVATTAGTSVAAHIAASRYDQLILEYLRTAQHLEHLRRSHHDSPGPANEFVDACEDVICTENKGWMTRWRTGVDETASGPFDH